MFIRSSGHLGCFPIFCEQCCSEHSTTCCFGKQESMSPRLLVSWFLGVQPMESSGRSLEEGRRGEAKAVLLSLCSRRRFHQQQPVYRDLCHPCSSALPSTVTGLAGWRWECPSYFCQHLGCLSVPCLPSHPGATVV